MQFSLFTGAAVLLALAPSVLAVGSATVINNCGYSIYYASVAQSGASNIEVLSGSYSETYSQPNVGISIKLAMNDTLSGPISQFEFTWYDGMVAYDISNINGYPFSSGGMEIVPANADTSAYPTCVPISCPAGETMCTAAYNQPDDTRTMVCGESTNLVMTMCPGGGYKRSESELSAGHIHHRVHARHLSRHV